MSAEFNLKDYELKMEKSYNIYIKDLSSLRTGRANVAMLDIIRVDVYGQKMPINQLATISTPESRLLTVQVWDQNNITLIDSAIKKSDLGINPQVDGSILRIPLPDLTEERRVELKKIIKSLAEKSKISVRNIRREANDKLKQLQKDKKISEDEVKKNEKTIQKITDEQIKQIDLTLERKEKEIMSV